MADQKSRGRRFRAIRMRKQSTPPLPPGDPNEVTLFVDADGVLKAVRRAAPEEE